MPKPEQPLRTIGDDFNKWDVYREIEFLHGRINYGLIRFLEGLEETLPEAIWETLSNDEDLLDSLEGGEIPVDLKTTYSTGDLDTEAEIIAALNSTNSKVNIIAGMLNLLLQKAKFVPPTPKRNS